MPTSLRRTRAWLVVVSCACGLGSTMSCSSDPASPPAPALQVGAASGLAPHIRPAVDMQRVIRRASLAFRASSDPRVLAAAGSTFDATVSGASLEVVPRRPERAAHASSTATGPLPDPRSAALSLETSLVARGSTVLVDATHAPSTTLERDGSVTLRRAAVAETIANEEDGVEQTWRFDRTPAGSGDLVVRVRAAGQGYRASTDHGLHFGATGSLGLRYGTATWVDASGKRTVVMPRFAGSEIVMVVPDEVVRTSSYPAVLDPTLTPEQEIDKPVSGSSASGEQYSPAIVSAGQGKGYLAVWYDGRGVRPALYGARIASDGTVLDDTGIPIAVGVGSTVPFVAASPTGFLVTWAISYVDLYQGPGIYAVRLDAVGNALDTTPMAIVANQTNLQQPSAAFDGTNWFIAWQRYGGGATGYDIAAVRLPQAGAVLDATPIAVSSAPEQEYQPIVHFDGTNHFVIWRSYSALYGRRYAKDGTALGARLTLATSPGISLSNFDAAFNGTEHLLVWTDYVTTSYDVFARRIDLAGNPLDAGNLAVQTGPDYDQQAHAAFDGTNFLVTFARSGQLMAQRMSVAGGLVDAAPILVNATNNYYDYALASDGTGAVALSRSFGSGLAGSDVTGVNVGKPPAASATYTVSKAANSETEPVTAWNGTAHFTVWLDTRDGRPAIYGASTTADGAPSAALKIVSDARYASDLTRPRIASDGAGYLVVFHATDQTTAKGGIRGVRIDATGKVDTTGIFDIYVPPSTTELAQEPDVAFDGDNYMVVWQDQTNDGSSQTGIDGMRLPKAATTPIEKEPIRISTATPVETRTVPSVAFDGQSYFVAWITSRPTPSAGISVSHVFGTRVSKDGAVLEGETAVCNAFLLQRAPFVAADVKNGGFMVVWEDYRTALDTADVYGARITSQGQNLDGTSGMKIAVGTHDESRPRVASSGDGTNWVVAWRDLRSKTSYDLYGSWISLAGKNHDPDGLLLSAEAGDEDAPWLDPSADGKLLLAYQRLDPRTGYGSYRVRARAIDAGAKVAAACTKDDDCASRSCADGVCCATECGGCGACNVTPGTCTPLAAGSEATTCPAYRCKGTVECPSTCDTDADCASNATCDPSSKKCVSRVICIDDQTLKDLTGKQTSCAPYKCTGDACRTQCGSVDDCANGFVCDYGGRCIQAPAGDDGGCAVEGASLASRSSGGAQMAGAVSMLILAIGRRRRRPA